jgi:transposase-like protein
LARSKTRPFKGRQFTAEVILWAVRWYLRFPIRFGWQKRAVFPVKP